MRVGCWLVFKRNNSQSAGDISRSPDSQRCHAREVAYTVSAACFWVMLALARAALMSSLLVVIVI